MTAGAHRSWTPEHTRYLMTETAIGVVVTIMLSCAFAAALFAGSTPIAVADPALLFDALIQAVIVAFMSCLVPTAIARRRSRAGGIAPLAWPHRWPRNLLVRSASVALLVGVPLAGLHAVVATRSPPAALDLPALLAWKACFGVLVALIATPWAVLLALREQPRTDPVAAGSR